MPRRARLQAATGVHHAIVRGINRDAIFLDQDDYFGFLEALSRAKAASGCSVLAYCLMPNHAHLVLSTNGESIGCIMKRLGVRYAGRFNRKYQRVGHVFQDRFRSLPVDDDTYFMALIRYVWNNPVQAGLVREPIAYRWNSCAPLQPAGLVDESVLDGLLPSLTRPDLAAALPLPPAPKLPKGRRPAHSADEVTLLLEQSCGARTPEEFAQLDPTIQRRSITELRTRSVAYTAIASVTGMSKSRVQRIHAQGRTVRAAA